MVADFWKFESEAADNGFAPIAGIDEAGRGPLAGPVVSAAIILPPAFDVNGINDSKKLTHRQRERLYPLIYAHARAIGIGIVDAVEIDRINILKASLLSMAMAVDNLDPQPSFLLVDGQFEIPCTLPQRAIPKGDCLSISIAAASIIAKVTRDRLMDRYAVDYPQFGFARHKGYPTQAHRRAIEKYGCCPIHRKSFKGVKEYLNRCEPPPSA
jgi:ribonuclease HII